MTDLDRARDDQRTEPTLLSAFVSSSAEDLVVALASDEGPALVRQAVRSFADRVDLDRLPLASFTLHTTIMDARQGSFAFESVFTSGGWEVVEDLRTEPDLTLVVEHAVDLVRIELGQLSLASVVASCRAMIYGEIETACQVLGLARPSAHDVRGFEFASIAQLVFDSRTLGDRKVRRGIRRMGLPVLIDQLCHLFADAVALTGSTVGLPSTIVTWEIGGHARQILMSEGACTVLPADSSVTSDVTITVPRATDAIRRLACATSDTDLLLSGEMIVTGSELGTVLPIFQTLSAGISTFTAGRNGHRPSAR